MYKPPDTDTACRLFNDIAELLIKSGGYYQTGLNQYAAGSILATLATGQFVFKKGCYFANWYFISDKTLEKHENNDSSLFEHILPDYDIISGEHMRVMECGCLDPAYMPELRRKVRKHGRTGVSWYREKKKTQVIHRHQTGHR